MAFDYSKGSVLFEFRTADNKAPTMEQFQKTFDLKDGEFDADYPFVPLERDGHQTFIAVVAPDAALRIQRSCHPDIYMNWSNGPIEPFAQETPVAAQPARKASKKGPRL